MNILSIQSAVSYGYAGNSAAVFPMQRLGYTVWPVYTVNFSNHTGYGAWRGPVIPAEEVAGIIEGIGERGQLENVDAVVSGYLGGAEIAQVVVDAVEKIRTFNPNVSYTCDPVMGSQTTGCFVADDIPPLFRDVIAPHTDIMTPNQFELGYLSETNPTDLKSTLSAVEKLRAIGPSTVLVTSLVRPDGPEGILEMLLVDDKGAWIVQTPRLPVDVSGSGDVTAALFTCHYLAERDGAAALAKTSSSVYDLLEMTFQAGANELKLIEAQEFYANPRLQFAVREL